MVIVYMLGAILTGLAVALVIGLSFFGGVYSTADGVIMQIDNVGGYYWEYAK
jgi:hypothetical protein